MRPTYRQCGVYLLKGVAGIFLLTAYHIVEANKKAVLWVCRTVKAHKLATACVLLAVSIGGNVAQMVRYTSHVKSVQMRLDSVRYHASDIARAHYDQGYSEGIKLGKRMN